MKEEYQYTSYNMSEDGKKRIIKKTVPYKITVILQKQINLYLFKFWWTVESGEFTSLLGGHINIANGYYRRLMDKYDFTPFDDENN